MSQEELKQIQKYIYFIHIERDPQKAIRELLKLRHKKGKVTPYEFACLTAFLSAAKKYLIEKGMLFESSPQEEFYQLTQSEDLIKDSTFIEYYKENLNLLVNYEKIMKDWEKKILSFK